MLSICVVAVAMASGQTSNDLTNARIVELSKSGLGDDIIIAKIKTGSCKFALSDNDLIELKKAGVSDKIVAAMLESAILTEPKVTIDGKPLVLHTLGQSKVGGRMGSFMTGGLKSVKQKSYLQGAHAAIFVSPNGAIEMELPKGDNPENYIIVRLDPKDDRRELETASVGGVVGGKSGLRAEATVKSHAESLGGNKHRLIPDEQLKKGEYIIYLLGSADSIKGIFGKGYDFTVE